MDQLEGLAQTYTQAPWRKQMQIIGLFALILVLIALVALLYLNVSARASQIGREIQDMQENIEKMNLEIEDMQSRLSMILSADEMERRALSMGFVMLNSEDVQYLKVPGYSERQSVVLAPRTERNVSSAPVMPLEYTESLFKWFKRQAHQFSLPLAEAFQ